MNICHKCGASVKWSYAQFHADYHESQDDIIQNLLGAVRGNTKNIKILDKNCNLRTH